MSEVPHFFINETTATIAPKGAGGDTIIVFGKTQHTAELTKVYTFYDYPSAAASVDDGGIGPEDDDNEALAAVKDIFDEAAKRDVTQQLGVEKVYVINMGTAPTNADYLTAQQLSEVKKDIILELYAMNSDLDLMNSVDAAIQVFRQKGAYRFAWFTHADGASISQIADMTDTTKEDHIRSSFVGIKHNRDMQARYAAKEACSLYYVDPSKGPYRSITVDDIPEVSSTDLGTLVAAGITPDWEYMLPLGSSGLAEPCRAVATSYRTVSGERPVDANRHVRRNVDYHFRRIDLIINSNLKSNDNDDNLEIIREDINSYLEMEKKAGTIKDYAIDVQLVSGEPYTIRVTRSIKPVNAIYFVEEVSYIQA